MSSTLILASGSPYRRELLQRLKLPFEVRVSAVDETPLPGETAEALVVRLARSKAAAVARQYPEACVIGSDQAAVCGGEIVGKPGDAERCAAQLRRASGRAVTFLTAVCVTQDGRTDEHLDRTTVHFRTLTDTEIARYVEAEKPFDCAGGFKVEGFGITLFDRIESNDPTGLVGLPLIWLSGALRKAALL